ncbi:DUF5992 family protein [Teredinibacter sp. KSP-S5-2]
MKIEAYNRTYSTAIQALSTGMEVDIYNYIDSACSKVFYIKVKNS